MLRWSREFLSGRIVPGLLQAQVSLTLSVGLAPSWNDSLSSPTRISRELARLCSNASLFRGFLLSRLAGRIAPRLEQRTAGPETCENSRVERTVDDVDGLSAVPDRHPIRCNIQDCVPLRISREVDRSALQALTKMKEAGFELDESRLWVGIDSAIGQLGYGQSYPAGDDYVILVSPASIYSRY